MWYIFVVQRHLYHWQRITHLCLLQKQHEQSAVDVCVALPLPPSLAAKDGKPEESFEAKDFEKVEVMFEDEDVFDGNYGNFDLNEPNLDTRVHYNSEENNKITIKSQNGSKLTEVVTHSISIEVPRPQCDTKLVLKVIMKHHMRALLESVAFVVKTLEYFVICRYI